jgi:predicted helicase
MAELGAALSALHLNYEALDEFPLEIHGGPFSELRVTKMRYGGNSVNPDKTVIQVNPKVTISGIPLEAHEFTLGTRSPLDWVVDRYGVSVDKASGIVNDSNTVALRKGEPDYPIKLIARLVTLSLETKRIQGQMPIDIDSLEI